MDFGLSEQQELLQETLRGFVEKECPPPRVREIFDGPSGWDDALWKGLSELGLAGLAIPEAYGGAGLELLDLALASELLGGGAVPEPLLGHSLAALAIALGGSEPQRRRWLPRLATGELLGSIALAEPDDAWEPDRWSARLDGGRLRGEKRFVPRADRAGLLVVGVAGGGLALLEPSAPGCRVEPIEALDRTRRLHRVCLEGAPAESLPEGPAAAPRVRDAGLVLLAADAFGCAWTLLRHTIDYLSTRRQFGTPIVQFQAVKHEIVDLATELEPARGLWWYAAHALDHLPDAAPRAAAMAKAHVTDRAVAIARRAAELHGGIGFTWECDVQIWLKRAAFDRAFLGDPDFHRDRCAALAGW